VFTIRVPFEEAFEWNLDERSLNSALHLHIVKLAEQAGVLKDPYATGTSVNRTVEDEEFVLSVMAEPADADRRQGRIYAAAPDMLGALQAARDQLLADHKTDCEAFQRIVGVLRKIEGE
jgi:hypothetical protein